MDKKIVKENILRQLELIVEQNNNLNANTGKIPQIELDIIKSSVRKLYDQIYDLEKANLVVDIVNTVNINDITPQLIAEIKETNEKPLIIINENAEEEKIEQKAAVLEKNEQTDEKDDIEVIFTPEPKAVIEDKVIEIKEETVKETIKKEEEKQKAATLTDLFGNTNVTIADKYKTETKSLNEKIHKSKSDKSIGSRMLHNPIKDLKSAIGINEKFLFINELFKGNMKVYNDSIVSLNDAETHEKAMILLDNMKNNYKWEDDMVAFLTLKDFVERKHSK